MDHGLASRAATAAPRRASASTVSASSRAGRSSSGASERRLPATRRTLVDGQILDAPASGPDHTRAVRIPNHGTAAIRGLRHVRTPVAARARRRLLVPRGGPSLLHVRRDGTPRLTRMIRASCHCGAVVIEADRLPRGVTECNCSICRRLGARWAYYTRKSARIVAGADAGRGLRLGRQVDRVLSLPRLRHVHALRGRQERARRSLRDQRALFRARGRRARCRTPFRRRRHLEVSRLKLAAPAAEAQDTCASTRSDFYRFCCRSPSCKRACRARSRARLRTPRRRRRRAARSARVRHVGAGPVLAERPSARPVPARRAVPRAARAGRRRPDESAADRVPAERRSPDRGIGEPRAYRARRKARPGAARGLARGGDRAPPTCRPSPCIRSSRRTVSSTSTT